jgi:hypothetical protein
MTSETDQEWIVRIRSKGTAAGVESKQIGRSRQVAEKILTDITRPSYWGSDDIGPGQRSLSEATRHFSAAYWSAFERPATLA